MSDGQDGADVDVETREQIHSGVSITTKLEQEKPWQDTNFVNYLYHEECMSGPEIAKLLGCSVAPIYERVEDVRSFAEANKIWQRRLPASFKTTKNGYERVSTKINGEAKSMAVHRLVVIAEHGIESVKNRVVHHENSIPWDNRPSNLRFMTQAEHVRRHFQEIPLSDKLAMLELSANTPTTHAEIADLKDVPRSTVNSIVARAKRGGSDV